jgi:integrase
VERGANQEKSKMVRGIHNLTVRECLAHTKKCKKLGITKLLCDGGGLYLRATPTGAASWIFRYEIDGIGHEHGLGSFNTFDLDEAREKARRCRQLRAEGKDPIAECQAARNAVRGTVGGRSAIASKSFKYCMMKYIAFNEAGWRSDKHGRDWGKSLERYAFPSFNKGNQLVSTITMKDVLAALQPSWVEHTETMKRVRGRIERVLDWAKGQGYRTGENPAGWRGGLDAHLNPKVRKATEHFAAVGYEEVPDLVDELKDVHDTASDALLFSFMSVARSREIRFALWEEFNLKTGVRVIPSARTKNGEEHKIPLTEDMVALLERQPTRPRPGMPRTGFVFCNESGVRPLGESAMLQRMKQLRPGVTVHGSVRSSFSTWAAEKAEIQGQRVRYEVREACLGHANDPVVAAYMRGGHLDERRQLLTAWGDYILRGSNVTPLRREVT